MACHLREPNGTELQTAFVTINLYRDEQYETQRAELQATKHRLHDVMTITMKVSNLPPSFTHRSEHLLQPIEVAYIIAKRTLVSDLYLIIAQGLYNCEYINLDPTNLKIPDKLSGLTLNCVSDILNPYQKRLESSNKKVKDRSVLLQIAHDDLVKSLKKCCDEINATLRSSVYLPPDKDQLKTAIASRGSKKYELPYPETAGQFLALGESTWEGFRARIRDINEWTVKVPRAGSGWKGANKGVYGRDDVIGKARKLNKARLIVNNKPLREFIVRADRDEMNETAHQSYHKDAKRAVAVWNNLLPQLAREGVRVPNDERHICENALNFLRDPEDFDDLDTIMSSITG